MNPLSLDPIEGSALGLSFQTQIKFLPQKIPLLLENQFEGVLDNPTSRFMFLKYTFTIIHTENKVNFSKLFLY